MNSCYSISDSKLLKICSSSKSLYEVVNDNNLYLESILISLSILYDSKRILFYYLYFLSNDDIFSLTFSSVSLSFLHI
jgi:hypothetical protein